MTDGTGPMSDVEPTDAELLAALAALTGAGAAEPADASSAESVGGTEDTAQGLLERGRGT